MTTRLDILRACSLGSIAMSLTAVGAMTVPRAVPLVMGWGERTGPVALVLAVVGLIMGTGVFALCYLFVACVVVAALARLFVGPEAVSRLVVDGAFPRFDRALLGTLRRLRIAR
jgi:hypothetical protein